MIIPFSEALRRLRIKKGYSQQRLADALHVDRSTVTKWETGDRIPDAVMISLLSDCLGVNVAELLNVSEKSAGRPVVIMVDDENIILRGGVPILEKAIPGAEIAAFAIPAEAVAYAKANPVSLAFLDIEMGRVSGLNVCRELLGINPRTNVIYLTAYREYSFDAWATGACGYLLKPITVDAVRKILASLRYPIRRDGGV
jgi:transcriptional regulator with XRE-family HTH domain